MYRGVLEQPHRSRDSFPGDLTAETVVQWAGFEHQRLYRVGERWGEEQEVRQ